MAYYLALKILGYMIQINLFSSPFRKEISTLISAGYVNETAHIFYAIIIVGQLWLIHWLHSY
jgi:hypothetical protein